MNDRSKMDMDRIVSEFDYFVKETGSILVSAILTAGYVISRSIKIASTPRDF